MSTIKQLYEAGRFSELRDYAVVLEADEATLRARLAEVEHEADAMKIGNGHLRDKLATAERERDEAREKLVSTSGVCDALLAANLKKDENNAALLAQVEKLQRTNLTLIAADYALRSLLSEIQRVVHPGGWLPATTQQKLEDALGKPDPITTAARAAWDTNGGLVKEAKP